MRSVVLSNLHLVQLYLQLDLWQNVLKNKVDLLDAKIFT